MVRGRTGSATSPTRTGIRRSGRSRSSATRSRAASTAGSIPRRTPITASGRAYIAGVWTRRPYRRRGLAKALLARVLVLLRERGMTSAYLGVDGLNPNQAVHLYESLGFEVHTSETDWTKPIPRDGDDGEDAP